MRIVYFGVIFILSSIFVYSNAFCHENGEHSDKINDKAVSANIDEILKEKLNVINKNYISEVKPIFEEKCFDCHGTGNMLPWYASIPGPKQLIQSDIYEAKKHLDMTNDFPFKGHGSIKDDLKALRKMLDKASMPPFRYKLLHWSSGLTEQETQVISSWLKKSENVLAKVY